MILMIRVWRTT